RRRGGSREYAGMAPGPDRPGGHLRSAVRTRELRPDLLDRSPPSPPGPGGRLPEPAALPQTWRPYPDLRLLAARGSTGKAGAPRPDLFDPPGDPAPPLPAGLCALLSGGGRSLRLLRAALPGHASHSAPVATGRTHADEGVLGVS